MIKVGTLLEHNKVIKVGTLLKHNKSKNLYLVLLVKNVTGQRGEVYMLYRLRQGIINFAAEFSLDEIFAYFHIISTI